MSNVWQDARISDGIDFLREPAMPALSITKGIRSIPDILSIINPQIRNFRRANS